MVLKEEVEDFLKNFNLKEGYDKFYQTIDLPFGYKIQGYNRDFEHSTWAKISKIIDFNNKKVAEIGCFHGYYCFEAKRVGALRVVGYDNCLKAIETAKEISILKGLDVEFMYADIDNMGIDEDFDIIMFMNILHHLKNPRDALRRVFSKAKSVVMEVQYTNIDRKDIIKVADENGHGLAEYMDGRPVGGGHDCYGNEVNSREILFFTKERMELLIVDGWLGTGKTTYAKQLENSNKRYWYINSEPYGSGNTTLEQYAKGVADILNRNRHMNFVIDGNAHIEEVHDSEMKKRLKYHSVRHVVLYCNPETMLMRRKGHSRVLGKELKEVRYEIYDWYRLIDGNIDTNMCEFVNSENGFVPGSADDMRETITL